MSVYVYVCLYRGILLTAEPIWFYFTSYTYLRSWEGWFITILREGATTLTREIAQKKLRLYFPITYVCNLRF